MNVNIGPFRLIDPPPGQADIIQAAYDAIDYPWDRLTPALSIDPDKVCLVRWVDTGQGTSGLFYGKTYEIHLSTRVYHLGPSSGFVFAHEVGHLVDRATLDDDARDRLMDLTHASPKTYREDALGETFNGGYWPNAHARPHAETWIDAAAPYSHRHNEAYADLFVRAFAPTVWDGSYLDSAPVRGDGWDRFAHTTRDFAAVRDLTLARDMHPAPPPAPTPEPVEPTEKEPAGMMLTDLAAACRTSGLPVIEVYGWEKRGHGNFASVESIACHHTAGPARGNMPSLSVLTHGLPRLDGPLCQIGLARDGTVYVVAAGVGWHAGRVRERWMDNWHAIGIEAEATGTDEWPHVQYDAYVRLCRALCDHYGVPASRVLGHKEICSPTGRKIDPNFDMDAFRGNVTRVSAERAEPDRPETPTVLDLIRGLDSLRSRSSVGWMRARLRAARTTIRPLHQGGGDQDQPSALPDDPSVLDVIRGIDKARAESSVGWMRARLWLARKIIRPLYEK